MKKITLSLVLLFCLILGYGQCPNFDIELISQNEVDNFAVNYPNCYEPTHGIIIEGSSNPITNLNGLYRITDAYSLFIINTQISNLNGLHNLVNVDQLSFWGNGNLISLNGLTSLQTIGNIRLLANNSISNLGGMNNIQSIDGIILFSNSSLNDITDLSFIESLDSLVIESNDLNSLSGLENLTTVNGDLILSDEQLSDFNVLDNLQHIGGSLYLTFLDNLYDFTAFSNIETLEGLYILDCPRVYDLDGLNNIHTITGRFRIGFNSGLISLAGIENIDSVVDLDIYENENLNSFKGLETIREIKNRVFINKNPALFSINALNNVSPDEIDEVTILLNNTLSVCTNELICTIIDDPSVNKTFFNNAPGCSSEIEVLMRCNGLSDSINIDLEEQVEIYPNPVSANLTISLTDGILFKKAIIYTISNEKVYESFDETVNISMFPKGFYFVEIETNKGAVVKKIIKA